MGRILDRLLHRRALRHWRRDAHLADHAPLSDLRNQRNRAHQLRAHLNQLLHVAEGRLALPQIGSSYFSKPQGTDWSWRPALWRGPLPEPGISSVPSKSKLGDEVQLFHDCTYSELTLRQLRNTREQDLAPFGLRMDVFQFDGSFLSLVIELPPEAAADMTRQHLLRIDTIIETEKKQEIFARLNIKHGPNTEQLVRELPLNEQSVMVEFDLAYSRLNEKRIEKIWLDLIFESPDMNQVILRDLTFSRHLRAAI
ncbi:hypothetical protein FEE96_00630 [Parasedimentitalea maritima]|uniref:Uncharacterized protein n=1 Tax=Parasedimentitalea maritima TaxID=2578117 RepID=A0A5R8ZR26_9RHOB|nr:DUF6478 family protein [Zongyanglinia marina]KAE9632317.1 hypothetical protein GP644_00635 [Zongyanglinia marina]TLP68827.1 hypothetical protein FEE96_00630 [Zongyanglinia marina]